MDISFQSMFNLRAFITTLNRKNTFTEKIGDEFCGALTIWLDPYCDENITLETLHTPFSYSLINGFNKIQYIKQLCDMYCNIYHFTISDRRIAQGTDMHIIGVPKIQDLNTTKFMSDYNNVEHTKFHLEFDKIEFENIKDLRTFQLNMKTDPLAEINQIGSWLSEWIGGCWDLNETFKPCDMNDKATLERLGQLLNIYCSTYTILINGMKYEKQLNQTIENKKRRLNA